MNTKKETIAEELLAAVDDPAGLEAVFQRHRGSKGPLYLGLAQATSALTERFLSLCKEVKEASTDLQEKHQQIEAAALELDGLQQQKVSLSAEVQDLNKQVSEAKDTLDAAQRLAGLGFGPDELGKLHHLLMDNTPEDVKPQDAITLFFKFVDAYPNLAAVDAEVQKKEQVSASLDGKIKAKQALLDQVQTIGGLGLGTKELVKLHNLLSLQPGQSGGLDVKIGVHLW